MSNESPEVTAEMHHAVRGALNAVFKCLSDPEMSDEEADCAVENFLLCLNNEHGYEVRKHAD